jgi:phosphatidylserine/phosphatidylglycerophosphate/cardiolipin synthase-like enzyme
MFVTALVVVVLSLAVRRVPLLASLPAGALVCRPRPRMAAAELMSLVLDAARQRNSVPVRIDVFVSPSDFAAWGGTHDGARRERGRSPRPCSARAAARSPCMRTFAPGAGACV